MGTMSPMDVILRVTNVPTPLRDFTRPSCFSDSIALTAVRCDTLNIRQIILTEGNAESGAYFPSRISALSDSIITLTLFSLMSTSLPKIIPYHPNAVIHASPAPLGPTKDPFSRVCDSRRRQRSWHHCQQLGDLLLVAGGVGSDATAEAVNRRAKAATGQPSSLKRSSATSSFCTHSEWEFAFRPCAVIIVRRRVSSVPVSR